MQAAFFLFLDAYIVFYRAGAFVQFITKSPKRWSYSHAYVHTRTWPTYKILSLAEMNVYFYIKIKIKQPKQRWEPKPSYLIFEEAEFV